MRWRWPVAFHLAVAAAVADAKGPQTLPDTLWEAQLHTASCSDGAASQLFRLNGTAAPHLARHIFTSGATSTGLQPMCWDCSGCQEGDRVFSVRGCQPTNSNQQWAVRSVNSSSAGGSTQWVTIGPSSGSAPPTLCLTAHHDGRAELLLQKCSSSVYGQHWSAPANSEQGTRISNRILSTRCVDAKAVDFSGVSGGFLLWPRPQLVEVGKAAMSVCVAGRETFTFDTSGIGSVKLITRATSRYGTLLPNTTSGPIQSGCLKSLVLQCTGEAADCSDGANLDENMNESYELIIPRPDSTARMPAATLEAQAIWGLLRGLETFSQMVEQNHSAPDRTLLVRAVPVRVSDRPRWPYRGLLIDTARHYMPVSLLRQHLDAMAFSKFNVLHWHHHDSGVWSLESTSISDLKRAAAAPGWQYSHADIRLLVGYARDRGIRVIPEFESP